MLVNRVKNIRININAAKGGILLCLYLGTLSDNVFGQNLEVIGKEKPIKVNGSVTANDVLYGVRGIPNRRPPNNYFLTGNLNLALYGWNVPLSFTYSNQQSQFQQPFNQFGMTPYYKWIKLYAGYNTMSFSPYTLNGHIFLGGGIQLTPGIFKLSAMYGRLNRAVQEDTNNIYSVPYFQRMGFGVKAGVGKGKNSFDLILFSAKDDPNSIPVPFKSQVLPMENLVLSGVGSLGLGERLVLTAEYASSALTRDIRSPELGEEGGIYRNFGFFKVRQSTAFHNAYKANLNYTGEGYAFGVGYEHIDPGYRTLGSYYFNDDLENYTANAAKQFWSGRLNISINAGIQKNNLKGDKMSSMNRFIGAINTSIVASQRLSFSASYTNFQTYTRVRSQFDRINQLTPYDNLDTLNVSQLSQSATLGTVYLISPVGDKNKREMLTANVIYQNVGNAGTNKAVAAGTDFYNGNVAYNVNITPKAITYMVSLNANYNEIEGLQSLLLGPTISGGKGFFDKKLKTNISISYTNSRTNGIVYNNIYNFRLGGTYVFQKKHSFNLSSTIVKRDNNKEVSKTNSFTEFTLTGGYGYTF